MTPMVLRDACVGVLPLALLFAGCAANRTTDLGPAPQPARPTAHATAGPRPWSPPRDTATENDLRLAAHEGEFSTPAVRHDLTLDEFRDHVRNRTAVVIDARSAGDFGRGHVRGARNLPPGSTAEMEAALARLRLQPDTEQLVIIYCSSASCESGDMVGEFLATHGFTNLRVFTPGWSLLATTPDLR
jgi:rhodanese-related sulfurtransferase